MRCPAAERLSNEGFGKAEAITRQYAKTFYFASRFLPQAKRKAAYVVYAICRISDDSVDRPRTGQAKESLTAIRQQIMCAYEQAESDDPLIRAFMQTIHEYAIARTYFDELLKGMEMDLEKNRYASFEELYTYCYRVAGVVGLIMLKIFGYTDSQAEQYAVELGIAMQLTNILRDIKEDYRRGRIYLPQDEMRQYGITEGDIAKETVSAQFVALLESQINRARRYYKSAHAGIPLIADHRCRRVALMMKNLYEAILRAIKENKYNVYHRRIAVPFLRKVVIAAKTNMTGN